MRGLLLILLLTIILNVPARSAETDCDAVKVFYVTNVSPSSAKLVWEGPPVADGYLYVISRSSVPPEKFGRYIKEQGLTEKGLASGTTYYAHVRVKCPGTGISQWSTVQFNTPPPVNTAITLDNTFAFSAYPSQAETSITVKIKGSNELLATVWIQDMYGREVGNYPLMGDRLHINVAKLQDGIYSIYYNDFYGRVQHTRFTKVSSRVFDNN